MNLFIDTNIFLSFYHFTSDDLEELEKLTVLLRERKVTLWLPSQVLDEFHRNRDNKINDALKGLKEQKLKLELPALCKGYEEFEDLRRHQMEYERKRSSLIDKINQDVAAKRLKADTIIEQLFTKAKRIATDENILRCARLRLDIGNPPGKNGSLGDAINWEALLANVPSGETLYFITEDKDYHSPIDKQQFNSFLLNEWLDAKEVDLVYYDRLSDFFKDHFPKIKFATELEKDLLIRDLANSLNFTETHTVVAKLRRYTDFTEVQLNALVTTILTNNQVYLIIGDGDVNEFVRQVITGHEDKIEPDNLERLRKLLARYEPSDDDDIW